MGEEGACKGKWVAGHHLVNAGSSKDIMIQKFKSLPEPMQGQLATPYKYMLNPYH